MSELQTKLAAAVDANFARQTEWLKTLVGFPSIRGEEAPCQDWIAREFAARSWAVDRYTLTDVAMENLPGFSPVMDTDYSRAGQVVASLRAPDLLGANAYLAGEAPSLADLMLIPHFVFLPAFDEGRAMLASHANVADWIARMEMRPSMKATSWEALGLAA